MTIRYVIANNLIVGRYLVRFFSGVVKLVQISVLALCERRCFCSIVRSAWSADCFLIGPRAFLALKQVLVTDPY